MKKILFFTLFFTLLHSGHYTLQPSERIPSAIDQMPKNSVADMYSIPQDTGFYASQVKAMNRSEQLRYDSEYNRQYFKPWSLTQLDIQKDALGWEARFIGRNEIFTLNRTPITFETSTQWIDNANWEALDTVKRYAITVRHTNLHALPTSTAFYRDPQKVGEGFPFNYNQNSSYPINLPLYISHFSKDKAWAFVQGSYTFGWVHLRDIALVDQKFMHTFQTGNYAITIRDNLRLQEDQTNLTLVKLGTLFPYSRRGYLFAGIQANGYAEIRHFQVSHHGILAQKPLPFTPDNVAKVAREFYNEPYGWGGWYQCRDCSATTRDFMGLFGIFLPRNSSGQAEQGNPIDIRGLPKAAKKQSIIEQAQPFRSLLYVPGHIVLYLGHYRGDPIILHTYWGIRKTDRSKIITGRTIITTTEPGKEREDVREESKLINTIQTIVNF